MLISIVIKNLLVLQLEVKPLYKMLVIKDGQCSGNLWPWTIWLNDRGNNREVEGNGGWDEETEEKTQREALAGKKETNKKKSLKIFI